MIIRPNLYHTILSSGTMAFCSLLMYAVFFCDHTVLATLADDIKFVFVFYASIFAVMCYIELDFGVVNNLKLLTLVRRLARSYPCVVL